MTRDEIRRRIISQPCLAFFDYWWSLKDQMPERIPRKDEFDPVEIPAILPHLATHDFRTPGKFMIRQFGTAIRDRMGADMTGRDYLDFVPQKSRGEIYQSLCSLADKPSAFRSIMETIQKSDKFTVSENLGFPFLDDQCDRPIIVMVNDLVEAPKYLSRPEEMELEILGPLEMEYIDLGFGIPDDDMTRVVLEARRTLRR